MGSASSVSPVCHGCALSTMRVRPSACPSAQRFFQRSIPDSRWRNDSGSCMSSHPEVKSLLAGTRSRVWLTYSPPLGSLEHWDRGSRFAMRGVGSTDSLPRTDIPLVSVGAERAVLPNPKRFGGKLNWVRSGRATHWASSFGCRLSCGRVSRLQDKEPASLPEPTTSDLVC